MPDVAILYGSTSDEKVMQGALDILDEFGVEYEAKVFSAHRQPDATADYVAGAEERGIRVIIAGAGLAAALPGVVASHTLLPVIGVPVGGGPLNGVDALYSIVQMPKGIPVATVGISNAKNAAHLALRILALGDGELRKKVAEHREQLKQ